MFAVIDCGTTMTRIYIVNQEEQIVASGRRKVGVRDTSITGSRNVLRTGIKELFFRVLQENGIADEDVHFAIASGMITSEIGLIELPHIVAPAGLQQLTEHMAEVKDPEILPIGRPVYFIRGVRNHYPEAATVRDLRRIDFMRGEEVQCMGIMREYDLPYPCSLVALSSHTKIIYINAQKQIEASNTTISGQFYEAILNSTNLGKSLVPVDGEVSGGYTDGELMETAVECVEHAGLVRTMLMPRFLQVLLRTDSHERQVFVDAAIAADDMKAFREMREQGYDSDYYLLYGHESRCRIYTEMLHRKFGAQLKIRSVYAQQELDSLTVKGAISVALHAIPAASDGKVD